MIKLYKGANEMGKTKEKRNNNKKKESTQLTEPENIYPAAAVMLEISKDEYSKERERSTNLDNKANIFLSALIAILALYIPIIPFEKMKNAYMESEKVIIVITTIDICILILACIFLVISFYYLYKVISVKSFLRINFENLNDETILSQSLNDVERGLLNHYNTILIENAKINDDKVKMLVIGIKNSIISFLLLSLATISLLIIIG